MTVVQGLLAVAVIAAVIVLGLAGATVVVVALAALPQRVKRLASLRTDPGELTEMLAAIPAGSPGRELVQRLVSDWSAAIEHMRRDDAAARRVAVRRRILVLRAGWLLIGLLAVGALAGGLFGGWAAPVTGGLVFFTFAVALPSLGLHLAHRADTP